MKTIIIANQKGGSGKSTLVTHLAVAAERAGDGPVVLTDTDPQGTTADWFNARAAQIPRLRPHNDGDPAPDHPRLGRRRSRLVIRGHSPCAACAEC
ncbi:MAG: ParA family protein [Burkholderiales bacterium]|nr:ParA family protein [Burkholderiales bacterium]